LQATAAIGARRLCYFAHYHPAGIVADYVLHYLAELKRAGFAVVVASTAALSEAEADKLRGACERLILRENRGLDFGSWIDCYAAVPPDGAEYLLLSNDSVYGPLAPLEETLGRLTAVPADYYGMAASAEMRRHIQSWFLLLRPQAFGSDTFRAVMTGGVPDRLAKEEIVARLEVGLTARLGEQGLAFHALYDPLRDGLLSRFYPFNPTHFLWEPLLAGGMPFVKVELLRDNPRRIASVGRWEEVVERFDAGAVEPIRADLALRRSVAASSSSMGSAPPPRRARLRPGRIYLPSFQRFVIRDYRLWRERRRVAAAANAAAFAALYAGAWTLLWLKALGRRLKGRG
jgi:hypothetical protein